MAYPDNLLVQGERVIVNKRPHWKVLILPTVFFILIIGAGAALAAWLNSGDWEYKSTATVGDRGGRGDRPDRAGAGAVHPLAHRAFRDHQPPRLLPVGSAVPPGAPDPARPDREHGNRGHLLGPADGVRVVDRGIVRRPAAQVPQCRLPVEGAGAAQPTDPGRTGSDPPPPRRTFRVPAEFAATGSRAAAVSAGTHPVVSAAGLPGPGRVPAAGLPAAGRPAGLRTARLPAHPGLPAAARVPAARNPGRPSAAVRPVQAATPPAAPPAPPGGPGQSEGRPASQS